MTTDRCWENRRVTVVGLGRSGVAAAQRLCGLGARVRATDAHDTEASRAARASLLAQGVEAVEIGGHTHALLEGSEALVVSPGVSDSSRPVQWAMAHGVPILSEIELAFTCCPSSIIAVTGTNGKSTVVTLIAEVLRAAGRPAIACGNLGIPFSSVINQLTPDTVAVVEVSSFQLLWCHQFRPKIGVLLNIGTNHLDRHQSRAAYGAAKARLFARQTPEDWAVLNGCDAQVVGIGERVRAQRVWFGDNRSNTAEWRLSPQTQRALSLNAQAILQVARLAGIPDPLTWQTIRTFRGLEHRLEHVATIHGTHFVNDSKSTTPDSSLFALNQTAGDVVLILGGRDKGLDFDPLIGRLHDERVKGIVLIGESRTVLRTRINGSTTVREAPALEDAVRIASEMGGIGTTVLFSPACASFDMFRDFEERGRAFKDVVQQLRTTHDARRTTER